MDIDHEKLFKLLKTPLIAVMVIGKCWQKLPEFTFFHGTQYAMNNENVEFTKHGLQHLKHFLFRAILRKRQKEARGDDEFCD